MWDVLALGAVAVDEVCYVDRFPEPNVKLEVEYIPGGKNHINKLIAAVAAKEGVESWRGESCECC